VRRLPPTLPEEIIKKLLEPYMPKLKFLYLARGDPGLGPFCYSRCYLSFSDRDSMIKFSKEFDGHGFRNAQGMSRPRPTRTHTPKS
jgi:hypothetical protein